MMTQKVILAIKRLSQASGFGEYEVESHELALLYQNCLEGLPPRESPFKLGARKPTRQNPKPPTPSQTFASGFRLLRSKEVCSKEVYSKEVCSKEVYSKEVCSKEVYSKEVCSKEVYSKKGLFERSVFNFIF
jgi:hypothetical protein